MMKDLPMLLENAELIYLRQSRYTKDEWHSSIHSHYFTEVFIVLSGNGNFIAQKDIFPIEKGDVVIINPYVQHTEISSVEAPLWYLVLGIDNLSLVQHVDQKQYFKFHDYTNNLSALLKLVLMEVEDKKQPAHQIFIKNLSQLILLQIYRDHNFQFTFNKNKSVSKDSVIIKDYIDSHFKTDVTLEEIAQQVHLDKYYIIHTFKENFGETPIHYLIKKRIQNAKELLISTDLSISEIAQVNGFSSQSYFNQAFKKEVQMTPMAYRKKKAVRF